MKKILALVLTLALCLGMAATPACADEVRTLNFWHSITNTTIYAAFEEVVNDFNNGIGAEKGIKIELTQFGSAAKLNTALTGSLQTAMNGSTEELPDIIMGNSIYMVDYILNAEALVNLTPYIEGENGLNMDDFYPCWLTNSMNYDEEHSVYCLPFQGYSEVVYYNIEFFQENNLSIPTTWDEMVELCKQIVAITGSAGFGWDNSAKMATTLLEQAGIGYTDAQGNLLFKDNLDAAIDTIQWYVDQLNAGLFRTAGDSGYFSGPFANQDIMMYCGSGVEGAYIDMKIDPEKPFHWATFPVPQMEGTQTPATFAENSLIAIMDLDDDAEKDAACWEFVKYFESTEAVKKLTSVGAYIPCLKSVAEDADWVANASPAQLTGVEQMDNYYVFYAFDTGDYTSNTIYTDLVTAMGDVLNNGTDLRTALEDVLANY